MLLVQNKSIWKSGFKSGEMTLLSHFAWLHPCGISLRSPLSTETDIVLAKVFLFPVISEDRSEQSVTHKARRLTRGLFIAAGVCSVLTRNTIEPSVVLRVQAC